MKILVSVGNILNTYGNLNVKYNLWLIGADKKDIEVSHFSVSPIISDTVRITAHIVARSPSVGVVDGFSYR